MRENPILGCQYHIVVDIVLHHTDGSFLVMQRDWNKPGASKLEITAGDSILKGEDHEDIR